MTAPACSVRRAPHGTWRHLALLLAVVLPLAIAALPATAADRIEPPLELLYAPQNMLVAGKLVEINPAGRLVFADAQRLSGESKLPPRIDVRVPSPVLAKVKRGDRYLFGYTLYKRDEIRPDKAVVNAGGAVMLVSPGLDPALFHDDHEIRAIIDLGRKLAEKESAEHENGEHENGADKTGEHADRGETTGEGSERASAALLERLLPALRGKNEALQNLAAHEIAMEPQLGERLGDRDRAILERFVNNSRALPSARSALLLAASRQPDWYGAWWRRVARKTVETTPVGGYDGGALDPSQLVLSAFEILELHKIEVAPRTLKRWVTSGSPILAEHALLALRRQAPAQEKPAIEKALADPNLPAVTRRFLNDHLRRLNLLNARLRERKGKSR